MDVLDQCHQEGHPRSTPLLLGLNQWPIWDGIKRKDRPKGYKVTHAILLEVLKGQEDACRLLLRTVLMSSTFKQCSKNLPLIFIKALSLNDARKEKMQHTICNHRSALASMEHAHMLDFAVLDKQMGALTLPESEHALMI